MVEDVVESGVEVLLRGEAGGVDCTVEKLLGAGVVLGGIGNHVAGGVVGIPFDGLAGGWSVGPAGVDAGEFGDGELRVGRDGDAVGVELDGAVLIEHDGADGEELHDFTSVILVGNCTGGRVGHGVVAHVEILAHGGAQGDVLHDLAVVCEGIAEEGVLVGDHVAVPDELFEGGDEDLAQGKGDTLAKLVRIGDGVGEEVRGHAALVAGDGVVVGDLGHGVLVGDPLLEAKGLNGCGVGWCWTEGGLLEESASGGGRDLRIEDADLDGKRG